MIFFQYSLINTKLKQYLKWNSFAFYTFLRSLISTNVSLLNKKISITYTHLYYTIKYLYKKHLEEIPQRTPPQMNGKNTYRLNCNVELTIVLKK